MKKLLALALVLACAAIPASAAAAGLNLEVAPKRADVGKKTCFTFTASRGGEPVEGAAVRFESAAGFRVLRGKEQRMKARRCAFATLATAGLLLVAAPTAAAAPSARQGESTAVAARATVKPTLSIRYWPRGYFGFVRTARQECMADREVVLYQRKGKQPDPTSDRRIKRSRSTLLASGRTGQWSARVSGANPVYAVASARGKCGRIVSRVLSPRPRSGEIPACSPDAGPFEYCRFDRLHLDLYGASYAPAPCPSFTAQWGRCSGYPVLGLYPWGGSGVRAAEFEWEKDQGPRSDSRSVKATMFKNNSSEPTFAYLEGVVDSPGSARFTVTEGWGKKSSDSHNTGRYFTPVLTGAGPGEVGGPLYINFENGRWGADIHIWGYLFER